MSEAPVTDAPRRIARKTPEFRRVAWGLACGGFSIFALLYCVQPLLPNFAHDFGVTPAQSSLAISASTTLMAFSMIVSALISDAVGRRSLMIGALACSAVATLAMALATEWWQMLALRALLGVTLSGLPAVAMAYLADEMEPDAIGFAMGLYISGNGIGGMMGRFVVSALSDFGSWRIGLAALGAFALVSAVAFWRILPPSRNFHPHPVRLSGLVSGYIRESKDPGLRILVVESFLMLGAFVMLYNYIGFRLVAPPFNLSQTVVGAIFIVYLCGSLGSAWMGNAVSRYGRRRVFPVGLVLVVVGLLLTLPDNIASISLGLAIVTFGFFGSHAVGSSWVGLRASPKGRAQASSLYLMCYYLGASVVGWAGGFAWSGGGWSAVVISGLAMMAIALAGAAMLGRVPAREAN